jgi:hypothetical protein
MDSQISAQTLGFVTHAVDVAPSAETMEMIVESIRYKNLVGVEVLSEKVVRDALNPSTPVRTRIEALGMLSKLAGVDVKKPDAASGSGVSITINIPSVDSTSAAISITSAPPPEKDSQGSAQVSEAIEGSFFTVSDET